MKKVIVLLFCTVKIFSFGLFTEDYKTRANNVFSEVNNISFTNSSSNYVMIQTSPVVPNGFYLGQISQNTFNPVTDIYFSLPTEQHVKLVIMNLLGEEVKVLFNDKTEAGTYKFSYSSNELPSGVYVFRLQSEDYNDIRKMLL